MYGPRIALHLAPSKIRTELNGSLPHCRIGNDNCLPGLPPGVSGVTPFKARLGLATLDPFLRKNHHLNFNIKKKYVLESCYIIKKAMAHGMGIGRQFSTFTKKYALRPLHHEKKQDG